MLEVVQPISELSGVRPDSLPPEVTEPAHPVVLRDLVGHWPVVQAAKESPGATHEYLRRFCNDSSVNAIRLPARHRGRVFYNDDFSGFNFERLRAPLIAVLDELQQLAGRSDPDTLYVGSTTVDACLPGFRQENDLPLGNQALVSAWLGNRTRVAAHYDLPDNLACCVAGQRRVTLFPPQEIEHLYPGPVDFTPAGQTVSLVDFQAVDRDRFPLFERALERAQFAELKPGDAVVIPSMWWHHIEAEGSFNVLVNYWWRRSPGYMDSPTGVLEYAMLAVRDLPPEQRAAWRALFDYYVFDFEPGRASHVPPQRRGLLGPMDEMLARAIRAQVLNRLRR